ncbi:S8 family serine peptidase [Halorutilales archaeon Cl-col2-1]
MGMRITLPLTVLTLVLLLSFPTATASDTVVTQDARTEIESTNQPMEVLVNLQDLRSVTTKSERRHKVKTSQYSLTDHAESTDGVRVLKKFWITNSVLVEIRPGYDYEKLTRIDGVRSIEPNSRIKIPNSSSAKPTTSPITATSTITTTATTYGIEQINATKVWSQYGTRGSGVKVAVLDSGVNVSHSDIELYTTDSSDPTYPGGWAEFDPYGGRVPNSEPHDTGNHGTHVSGIVAGDHTGVAPNVSLMHALVMNDTTGTLSQALAGLEWAVENDADVVTMSIGGATDQAWIDAVENANQMGTVVATSTGNSGDGTSSSPGNVYDVLSVGAVDSNLDVPNFSSGEEIDTDSEWGTSAPKDWPSEYVVPDVVAAGVYVNSTSADGGYRTQSGTSMATPHLAGATALAISAAGDKSPRRISDAFALTAYGSETEMPSTRYGHGVADAFSATRHLRDTASVSGTVVNSTGVPIEESEVIVEGLRVDTTSGKYKAGLAEGTWELEVSAPGYENVTETVTLRRDEDVERNIYLSEKTPANFEVTLNSTNSPIIEGETLSVNSTVVNTGDLTATQKVKLEVGGNVRDSTQVSLRSSEAKLLHFQWSTQKGDNGTYVASVRSDNHSDSREVTIEENNTPPKATFSYTPDRPTASHSVVFDGSSSSDPDGDIQSYSWSFGDGTTASKKVTSHSYSSSGQYLVQLTIKDDNGATDTTSEAVSVSPNDGAQIDEIQTSLSDTDSDGLSDQIYVNVSVSNVSTGQTTVTFGESNFDIDISPTDTTQAQFVTLNDTDGDGINESVEFVELLGTDGDTLNSSYSITANISNQSIGETGTVNAELSDGTASSIVFVVEDKGSLDPNNPFGDRNGRPVDRQTVINRIIEWNIDDSNEIDDVKYTRTEIIQSIIDWNKARA